MPEKIYPLVRLVSAVDCPLSNSKMEQPVILPDGYSYEEIYILDRLRKKKHALSIFTGESLYQKKPIINRALQNYIEDVKNSGSIEIDPENPPKYFICPIGCNLLEDPVVLTTNGDTYERNQIEAWMKREGAVCPTTRASLTGAKLIPNLTLKYAIDNCKFKKKQEQPLEDLPKDSPQESRAIEASDIALESFNANSSRSTLFFKSSYTENELAAMNPAFLMKVAVSNHKMVHLILCKPSLRKILLPEEDVEEAREKLNTLIQRHNHVFSVRRSCEILLNSLPTRRRCCW